MLFCLFYTFFSWWATVVANGDRLTASPQPIRCLQPKKNDRYASSKPELSRLQQETRRSTKHFWRDRLTAFVDRHLAWFMCFRFISCSSCLLTFSTCSFLVLIFTLKTLKNVLGNQGRCRKLEKRVKNLNAQIVNFCLLELSAKNDQRFTKHLVLA